MPGKKSNSSEALYKPLGSNLSKLRNGTFYYIQFDITNLPSTNPGNQKQLSESAAVTMVGFENHIKYKYYDIFDR